MGKVLRNRFHSWNLNKKINAVVTGLNCCVSIILLAIFTSLYISSYITQANGLMRNQLSALASNYEYVLNSYEGLAETILIDSSIQDYLNQETNHSDDSVLSNSARNILQNAVNMYPSIDYIAVMSTDLKHILFKGNVTKISSRFVETYKIDSVKSVSCRSIGPLRMSYSDAYLGQGAKTLNLYIPIYSTQVINRQVGQLCLVFNGSLFQGCSDTGTVDFGSQGQVMMIDNTRTIISCAEERLSGTRFEHSQSLSGDTGYFVSQSSLYNYRKINQWNFYLVSQIPLMKMYRNCIVVLVLLTFILIAVTFTSLAVCKKIINRNYAPLDRVVRSMNSVAGGNLDVRIKFLNAGNDFEKLTDGFNYMMDKMNALMQQVKAEQQQMDQIRFNALQSQIQPHFLYNALDGIHWKAVADGNLELSEFVKALAKYYRICLSKGKDVISLEQEIEHVKNYLLIQNMRYDEVIRSSFQIGEGCGDALIPKITLQPLVENSIYHGIRIKDGKSGEIKVTAFRKGNEIRVTVADDGTGMTDQEIAAMNRSLQETRLNTRMESGYGIRNVSRRLKLLFGEQYGLHYSRNQSGGITVTVLLPGSRTSACEEVL